MEKGNWKQGRRHCWGKYGDAVRTFALEQSVELAGHTHGARIREISAFVEN